MALYKGSLRVCPIVPKWRGFWAVTVKGFSGTVVDCGTQKTIGEEGFVVFKFAEAGVYTFVAEYMGEVETKTIELVEGVYFVNISMYNITGYTMLQYIQNTTSTYINTGIIGKGGLSTKVKVSPVSTGEVSLLSCRAGGSGRIYLGCRIFNNAFSLGFNNEYTSDVTPGIGEEYLVEYTTNNNLGIIKVNDEEVLNRTIDSSYNSGRELYMFANNYDSGLRTSSPIRCHYLEIYDGNRQIAHFIPVQRDSDGEVGMYDFVSKTFFTNAGTGEFVPGPEV